MRLFSIPLALLLVGVALLNAQDRPAVTAQANTVFAGGDGKFEAAPDTAVLQFSVSEQESTAKAAYDQVSKSTEQVRQVLRANGIDPKSAEFGFFSTNPVYDYIDPKHKLIGYKVSVSVSLKFKDFTKVPPVIQQLSDAGITESQNLNYTLEATDSAKSKAVEDAYRRARESAEAVARAAGRTLGELSYAAVDVSESSPTVMKSVNFSVNGNVPAPSEEFSPQNVTVTAHVNALFNLK